jgi:hypothetical protein
MLCSKTAINKLICGKGTLKFKQEQFPSLPAFLLYFFSTFTSSSSFSQIPFPALSCVHPTSLKFYTQTEFYIYLSDRISLNTALPNTQMCTHMQNPYSCLIQTAMHNAFLFVTQTLHSVGCQALLTFCTLRVMLLSLKHMWSECNPAALFLSIKKSHFSYCTTVFRQITSFFLKWLGWGLNVHALLYASIYQSHKHKMNDSVITATKSSRSSSLRINKVSCSFTDNI